jgi:hypothetical protein
VHVPPPARARFVPPEIAARVDDTQVVAQLRDVSSGLPLAVRPGDPVELAWAGDAVDQTPFGASAATGSRGACGLG